MRCRPLAVVVGARRGRPEPLQVYGSYTPGVPSSTASPVVAFDAGPLHGPATGIARATAGMHDAIRSEGVGVIPYVLSFRARLRPGTVRLRYPAALALRTWARFDRPDPTRALRRAGAVELVHGTNYVVPPSRLPRLVSVYDCWALAHPDSVHRDVRLMMAALGRAIDTGAHVHASSHATATRLREIFPGVEVTTIHLGAPDVPSGGSWTPLVPEGEPYVLSLGTIERRKNLPFLVSSMTEVLARLPRLRLVIAGGDGDDRRDVDAAVDALPSTARERVHLIGRVDDAVAVELLRRASVLAYPSLDEGFGFPVLEAMSVGTPVVASNVGSIPEVAGDAALLCGPRDSTAWAEALCSAVEDDTLRGRLSGEGRLRAAGFSWATTGRSLADLYRGLVEGRVDR